ncbi:hypothetical protein BH23PLA1_BH23PLA1_21980 [soil metagenome]
MMHHRFDRFLSATLVMLATAAQVHAVDDPTPAPDFEAGPIGWALAQGGTKGGQGGEILTVSDAESFSLAIRGNEPRIVQVSGTIRLPELGRVGSNKTVIGLGSDAKIEGGLRLVRVSNVIIRNLAITGSSDDAIDI